jgi:hypothetical protein
METLLISGGNKMKRLGIIMSMLFVVSLLALGASAQDQSPGGTSMLYSMMGGGGGGMTGGGRGGMMGGGWLDRPSSSYDRYGNMQGRYGQYRNNPESNGQYRQSDREEIDILKQKIIEKRRELSRLYQSQNTDADVMNEKIEELNRLEQRLDDKLSSRR